MKRLIAGGFLLGVIAVIVIVTLASRTPNVVPTPAAPPDPSPSVAAESRSQLPPPNAPDVDESGRVVERIDHKAETVPAEITAFSAWAERHLAGDPDANAARGEALAWKRRQAMFELMESDPERAIANAVPFSWRAALPASVTRHFEQWVDGRGDFNVSVGTDFERGTAKVYREVEMDGSVYQAFVYGKRKREVSQSNIPLHGLTLEQRMALHTDSIRILEPAEAAALQQARGEEPDPICGVSGQPSDSRQQEVIADVGGEVRNFCGVDHLWLVNAQLAKSGEGSVSAMATAAMDAWTHGSKNVLYMRVNFPDDLTEPISEAQAYSVMDRSNDFYTENSYNFTSFSPMVTPLLTLPETKFWYSTAGPGALMSHARAAARRAGFETANYPLDIVALTSVPGYDWGGLGAVRGKSTWLQSTGVGVTCHELGHNYGLWHANFWDAITNYSSIGTGTNWEYGNIFDTMGAASAGNNHFNAPHKNTLNWLKDPAIHTITNDGVYQLYPFDAPDRISGRYYAARVVKDALREYWIEYRRKFASNPWLQHGVLLTWGSWEESNGGTHLLDTTPGTPTGSNSRQDAAVVIGCTFSDTAAGVHITPVALGATGTNVWIEVQVNRGAFLENHAPVMQVEVDPPNAAPGQLVHFHATAIDPNGDTLAYAWTFDDLSFSTNNLPWTFKSWSAPGEKVVRCQVSDMKGGVASANALVTVGAPTGFRIMGRILDAEGEPIEGVRVDNSNSEDSSYIGGYTDSHGAFIIVGVTDDLTLDAFKYGFTFTNLNWVNPIPATGDVVNVDFRAIPLPTVTIAASTNQVPENSSAPREFVVTRTGEVTDPLTIAVHLGGMASVGSDFTIEPSLERGMNSVTIPADEASLVFTFQIINDTAIEGPETIMLTIIDDAVPMALPPYVVGRLGEATVTILDNDFPGSPAVSVATLTPTIHENGIDAGTLVFTRTGSTAGDLTVFYSAGGTATPGVDYTSLLGVAIIPAGSASTTIQFHPIDDKDVEPDETVIVQVSPNALYTVSGSSAQITITDDDVLTVTVFPTGDSAAEPSTSGRFTVKRDGDLTANLVVHYSLSGSATSGVDYAPLSGSVTIPARSASVDILVQPLDDDLIEGDESVILTLSTNAGYNIGTPGVATLWIRDNEKPLVSLTAPDSVCSEPGDDTALFRVSRGNLTSGNLSVFLDISGSALPGADYLPLENPVVIPDGASSVDLLVIAFDDLHKEPTEDIILTLRPSTNYNGSGRARVIILDDDDFAVPAVGFTSSASGAPEQFSPGIGVSLSHTSSAPITVEYQVIGGTASPADYSLPSGPLVFNPGEWAKSLPLQIVNDTTPEPDETIRIVLFNPINATHDGIRVHTYTIIDDDTASVSIAATASTASETGPVQGNFRITRAGSTAGPLQVNFEVTGSASAPSDYAPLGTSAIIPDGATFVDLPVIPVDDQTVEHPETVTITLLTAPTARIVSPNVATVTIFDNDPDALPVVAVTATNHPAAVEGGANGEFLFTRDRTGGALTLHFSLTGTAANGVDYVLLPSEITIPDGQLSVALPVVAIDDTLIEGEETLILTLTVRDTYRVAHPSSALVMIQDNDESVRLDASDFLASEPGTDIGEFTFTRFGTTNTPLEVFFTISGTAINGVDYAAISNSFTIPAGQSFAVLPIVPLDDLLVEGPETVTLTLQSHPSYALGASTHGTVTIDDDEPMLTITATITNIIEGSRPPSAFRISRTGDPKYDFTAVIAVGGTATFGVDYPPFMTNVYFSCGVTAIDLIVAPTNELVIESAETVTAALVPDPAYTILSPSNAVITIEDAGSHLAPIVTITSPTAETVFLLGTNVNMILEATVTDDGDTNTPVVIEWSQVSGPDSLIFGDTNIPNTTVSFTNAGVYVLRITADDGELQSFAEVTAVVGTFELLSTNSLYWTFDEGDGTNVLDVSGNDRNGAFAGAPVWTTDGAVGGALEFGGSDFVYQTEGSNALDNAKAFTLSLWIHSDAGPADQGIFTGSADLDSGATFGLFTKTMASCGNFTNVLELTVPTAARTVRRLSASDTLTNGWQHIALTWSNGLAPALYINGQLDQPLSQFVPLPGRLTNCLEFIVGRGPADHPDGWHGRIDDVRVFPRALGAAEVAALVATNYGALVNAGEDITVQVSTPGLLAGVVEDDGRPEPPGVVSNVWLVASGPGTATFADANAPETEVEFSEAGEYVLRLIADDGQVKLFDDVTVTVIEPTLVYVFAGDPTAAELGPDTGQFFFYRVGDLNFDLTVYLAISGTASNGADFITLTNEVTFPAGVDNAEMIVTPFLDDRIEGDETVVLTIVSNAAYTIGNPEATVIIHDSPYGAWSVARFTIEELTFPELSGASADFDHDGFVNFAEYAANRDPKVPENTLPVVAAIEVNPGDNLEYITFTYPRRLPPTDTMYEPAVSDDLETWNTGPEYIEEIEVTDDGNGLTETVKARLTTPWPSPENVFITVRIWLMTTGP